MVSFAQTGKVIWVYAETDMALVVDVETVRDSASLVEFPCNPMGSTEIITNPNFSIAVSGSRAHPYPTWTGVSLDAEIKVGKFVRRKVFHVLTSS